MAGLGNCLFDVSLNDWLDIADVHRAYLRRSMTADQWLAA